MMSRGRLQSVNHRKRKKQRLKMRAIFISLGVLAIAALFIGVTHLSVIRIANIYPVGNKLLQDDEVRTVVKDVLSGSYAFVFPKDNILYFSRRAIEQKFLNDHQEVRSVKVSLKDFRSITVTFSEREPVALFCTAVEVGSPCYFTDRTGYVFKEGPTYGIDASRLAFIGQFSTSTIGTTILSQTEFESILSFVDLLKKQQIELVAVNIKNGGVREGIIKNGGTLIWNSDEDLGLAYQNLLLLISSPKFDGKQADGTLRVEYIDLQNQNKVFYKIK